MTSSEPQSEQNRYHHALGLAGNYDAVLGPPKPEPRPRPAIRVEGVGTVHPDGTLTREPAPTPPPRRPLPKPTIRRAPQARQRPASTATPAPTYRVSSGTRIQGALNALERAELDAYRAQESIVREVTQW